MFGYRLTFNVTQRTHPYSIISNYHVTSIWVWVASVIGGLLTVILITFGLYKAGFFKRAKKDELEQYKKLTHRVTPEINPYE